jgi:hypothetical protein
MLEELIDAQPDVGAFIQASKRGNPQFKYDAAECPIRQTYRTLKKQVRIRRILSQLTTDPPLNCFIRSGSE